MISITCYNCGHLNTYTLQDFRSLPLRCEECLKDNVVEQDSIIEELAEELEDLKAQLYEVQRSLSTMEPDD